MQANRRRLGQVVDAEHPRVLRVIGVINSTSRVARLSVGHVAGFVRGLPVFDGNLCSTSYCEMVLLKGSIPRKDRSRLRSTVNCGNWKSSTSRLDKVQLPQMHPHKELVIGHRLNNPSKSPHVEPLTCYLSSGVCRVLSLFGGK